MLGEGVDKLLRDRVELKLGLRLPGSDDEFQVQARLVSRHVTSAGLTYHLRLATPESPGDMSVLEAIKHYVMTVQREIMGQRAH